MSVHIECREQSDGRWLVVRVASGADIHRGWISPREVQESIGGATVAGARDLIDVMAEGIRARGVKCVLVPKGGSK